MSALTKISRLISPAAVSTISRADALVLLMSVLLAFPLGDDFVQQLLRQSRTRHGDPELARELQAEVQILVEHLAGMRTELELRPSVGNPALRQSVMDDLLQDLRIETGFDADLHPFVGGHHIDR